VTAKEHKLVVNMFPALATELQQLLVEQSEPELAAQVPGLTVIDDAAAATTSTECSHTARAIGM
jgi:hypothetical protein